MVKPISLRIRSSEATGRAREVLRRVEADDRLRRRVGWQATKALVAVREMQSIAGQAKSFVGRDRWLAECKLVESILLKISKRGV